MICLLFLLESVIISSIGCMKGLSSGICVLYTVFYVVFESIPELKPMTVLVPCVSALAVGLISGVVPAFSASRMSPVNAIRRE